MEGRKRKEKKKISGEERKGEVRKERNEKRGKE